MPSHLNEPLFIKDATQRESFWVVEELLMSSPRAKARVFLSLFSFRVIQSSLVFLPPEKNS